MWSLAADEEPVAPTAMIDERDTHRPPQHRRSAHMRRTLSDSYGTVDFPVTQGPNRQFRDRSAPWGIPQKCSRAVPQTTAYGTGSLGGTAARIGDILIWLTRRAAWKQVHRIPPTSPQLACPLEGNLNSERSCRAGSALGQGPIARLLRVDRSDPRIASDRRRR